MPKHTCLRCGSDQIIPNVPLSDRYGQGGGWSSPMEVQVHGSPDAWLFKDTASGELVAYICGACGHAELKALGYLKLYRKYQESQGGRVEGRTAPPPLPAGAEAAGDEQSVCLACGQVIAEGATRCEGCGWSWGEGGDE